MEDVKLNDFCKVRDCDYKGELYSVRDNGAILRHSRKGKSVRPCDNKWTFGRPSERTGYMEMGSERVHRIVAFAFLGAPPSPEYVVDHIDTNRRNNRPENLHWVTRLENALGNPITRKKIVLLCGSIEAFLKDPRLIRKFADSNKNYSWMRTVSVEEAKNSYEHWKSWANKKNNNRHKGSVGDWVYNKYKEVIEEPKISLFESITPTALQRDWKTPTEFLCCPIKIEKNTSLTEYNDNIAIGKKFSRNNFCETKIIDFTMSADKKTIFVLCEATDDSDVIKPWSITIVTFENNKFIHTNGHTFFSEDGAKKRFTILQGKIWTGGETYDDFW